MNLPYTSTIIGLHNLAIRNKIARLAQTKDDPIGWLQLLIYQQTGKKTRAKNLQNLVNRITSWVLENEGIYGAEHLYLSPETHVPRD